MNNKLNYRSFSQVPVRSYFYYEGVRWYKRSKRTANVSGYSFRWKHFSKKDLVQQ
jgi:hypothetical protein